ncbi:hypothetical protein JW905_14475 [bacterium]|nr:hypothetical protein [candidate division CSSED10-310 bacterium]
MEPKQFVMELRTGVGRLARITEAFAHEGINVMGISARDLPEATLVRMLVDDAVKAERILREIKQDFAQEAALVIPIRNKPGALHSLTQLFSANGLKIYYLYVVIMNMTNISMLFCLDDNKAGARVMMKNGFEFMLL